MWICMLSMSLVSSYLETLSWCRCPSVLMVRLWPGSNWKDPWSSECFGCSHVVPALFTPFPQGLNDFEVRELGPGVMARNWRTFVLICRTMYLSNLPCLQNIKMTFPMNPRYSTSRWWCCSIWGYDEIWLLFFQMGWNHNHVKWLGNPLLQARDL